MCSIVSWMTSHSTGQRGAGRENGACGSPGDLQGCFKGASLPWWGVCTTPRAARAPGRAGDFQCGWGRGILQNQGRDRERPSPHTCCAQRTLCSGGCEGLQGLTHGLAPAQDLVASQGRCCPWWMPWDAARSVSPGPWQSPPCLSSHLGENSHGAGGDTAQGQGAQRPGLTSEVAIEAQVGADEAVIGLQELSPTEPPRSSLPALGSAAPCGLHGCESPGRPGTAKTASGLGWHPVAELQGGMGQSWRRAGKGARGISGSH